MGEENEKEERLGGGGGRLGGGGERLGGRGGGRGGREEIWRSLFEELDDKLCNLYYMT